MAKSNRQEIQAMAQAVLQQSEGGIRWMELLNAVALQTPETPKNSVHGALHNLLINDENIVKVARGTYQLKSFFEANQNASNSLLLPEGTMETQTAHAEKLTLLEHEFYQSFAQWLVEMEEVNAALPVGGNILRGKWGTPDVLGVLKPWPNDILKFEPQIVTAEIKIDAGQPVVAFGQAVAYRLFSHKVFIVVPNTTTKEDLSRLEALCTIHGVGLVTFTLDKLAPDYTVVVLPLQSSPDMFYANQMC